jgi:hypothetical protein
VVDEASSRVALVLNVFSFGLAAFVIVALLLQVSWLFGLVTLGPASVAGPSLAMARYIPGPLRLGTPAAILVAGLVLVGGLRKRDSAAWLYRTVVTPIPLVGMVSFEMLAYRLVGLLALAVGIWAYVEYVLGRGRLRLLVYASLIMLLAGVLPFDVSLQNLPGSPRWLPTMAGLPTRSIEEAAERGEHVIVGGCVPAYTEPTWVWVW